MVGTTTAVRLDPQPGDNLEIYFASVSRIPLMTREEEARTASLFRETGSKRYSDKLVSANLRFVIRISLEYRNYGFRLLDLVQEGNLGLIRAVRSYDPDRGFRLISYAVWWIRAFVQEYILKNWSLVKIGTTQTQRKLFNLLQSSQRRLDKLTGSRDPLERRKAIAESVGGTLKDVEDMELRLRAPAESLDGSLSSPGDYCSLSYERLASEALDGEQLLDLGETQTNRARVLSQALARLDERERTIVVSRHLSDERRTLRYLGESMGISKERVRQLEQRALSTIREDIAAHGNVHELF